MTQSQDWAGETEQRVLDEAIALVPAMGWSRPTVIAAAAAAGLSEPEAELLLPHGARDLAALLSRRHDAAALATLSLTDPNTLKIRERIRVGVIARLDAARAQEATVRRWAGFLSLPTNLPLALRLVWESADVLWRWAGDTATDENHYSKRAILSGILVTCLAIDMASGREEALTHLDRSIDNVMAFEKWKAAFKPTEVARDVAGALSRMRYR
ncbi:MAG TPA: COQ9 family protein [Caulobacteraceae bacterium]|nr:COQ9 family protein [Caulobacteraceae bacterium]